MLSRAVVLGRCSACAYLAFHRPGLAPPLWLSAAPHNVHQAEIAQLGEQQTEGDQGRSLLEVACSIHALGIPFCSREFLIRQKTCKRGSTLLQAETRRRSKSKMGTETAISIARKRHYMVYRSVHTADGGDYGKGYIQCTDPSDIYILVRGHSTGQGITKES